MGTTVAALSRCAWYGLSDRLDWWPDWRGETVAIIASGPSAKQVDVELLVRHCRVLAIKENVELFTEAEVVYGCDGAWWKHRRGLPDFKGIKIGWDECACAEFGLRRAFITDKKCDELLLDEPMHIGSGGNSGFQALNLAVQFGAPRIALVGFDMTDRPGAHWYGRNNWPGANNPSEDNFRRWRAAFDNAAPVLSELGISVVNVASFSALKSFPRIGLADALRGWNP